MKEKVVLFDGANLDNFVAQGGGEIVWEIKDGVATAARNSIVSKYEYGDAHIHVEFRIPYMPDMVGQNRGNSGVYIQGCYELQVLDSYGIDDPKIHDCAAIYNYAAPITNACIAPEEWQSYDIILKAAKLNDDGTIADPAVITVLQNGIVVHNNLTLPHHTPGGVNLCVVEKGPLMLQYHSCPVSFRNIWIQPLD